MSDAATIVRWTAAWAVSLGVHTALLGGLCLGRGIFDGAARLDLPRGEASSVRVRLERPAAPELADMRAPHQSLAEPVEAMTTLDVAAVEIAAILPRVSAAQPIIEPLPAPSEPAPHVGLRAEPETAPPAEVALPRAEAAVEGGGSGATSAPIPAVTDRPPVYPVAARRRGGAARRARCACGSRSASRAASGAWPSGSPPVTTTLIARRSTRRAPGVAPPRSTTAPRPPGRSSCR